MSVEFFLTSLVVILIPGTGVVYTVSSSIILDNGALALDGQNDQNASAVSVGLVVRRGVLLNLLNPKLTVFFFAFLPQFLDAPSGLLDTRLIGLGGVFMVMTLAVFAVYA